MAILSQPQYIGAHNGLIPLGQGPFSELRVTKTDESQYDVPGSCLVSLHKHLPHSSSMTPVNSLAPGRFQFDFRYVIFKLILVNGGWGISDWIAFRWMPLDLTDDESTLVQVMAWCSQATNHYLSQCWPRFMSPYGIIGPQKVKEIISHTSQDKWILFLVEIGFQFKSKTYISIPGRDCVEKAPSQWKVTLHCNVVSHWLGPFTKWCVITNQCPDLNGSWLTHWGLVTLFGNIDLGQHWLR